MCHGVTVVIACSLEDISPSLLLYDLSPTKMQVMGDWEEITSRLNKTSYHFKKNTEIRSILSNLAHS